MITVACCLWDPTPESFSTSLCYDETWAEKLYRGFARNLSKPFRFVCFVDKKRHFDEPEIEQKQIMGPIGYAAMIEPFKLNEPMILCGLDTIITGNCDVFAEYCLTADKLAVPRDPIFPEKECNGVALVPGGLAPMMWERFDGRNDMDWINANPHAVIDDLFPGLMKSYRIHMLVEAQPLDDARIVYFHGQMKPHQVRAQFVEEHWR